MSDAAATRRAWLCQAGAGLGSVALADLLASDRVRARVQAASESDRRSIDSPRPLPHFAGSAKSVIFLFMDGGPSHLDTFDPKPAINEYAGQPLPKSIRRVITPMGISENGILASPRTWTRYGESGLPVSEWYRHVGSHADRLCVLRACVSDALNHVGGVCQMNTGSILAGRPSLGAWVTYGLASENANLPSFVVLLDNDRDPPGGNRVWSTGFMPATYQGTKLQSSGTPILHLNPPAELTAERQAGKLRLLDELNREHADHRPGDDVLEARIRSYELAFRMQQHAPEAVDLSQETEATQRLYGLDQERTRSFGRNCLLARRLVERGVRFIQLYSGSGSKWDAHTDLETNHQLHCSETDLPIAGLLTDLQQRGLLDQTLIVWGGEFGRTPMSEKGNGRDHNPYGFTMWLAGGGVQGGQVIGATDDFGMHAESGRCHIHDLHATILAALGLDHFDLIYRVQGRPERATVNEGSVVDQVFGIRPTG
jgi:hypothetical protein